MGEEAVSVWGTEVMSMKEVGMEWTHDSKTSDSATQSSLVESAYGICKPSCNHTVLVFKPDKQRL